MALASALGAVAVVYALASVVDHVGVKEDEGNGFQAAPLQTAVALGVVLVLALVAWWWPARPARASRVPPPWALALVGFVAYLLYLPGEGAGALVVAVLVIALVVLLVGSWARSTRWTSRHATALAIGAFLVGAVAPFLNEPYDVGVSARSELLSDLVAAAVCLAVVGTTLVRRTRWHAEVHVSSTSLSAAVEVRFLASGSWRTSGS